LSEQNLKYKYTGVHTTKEKEAVPTPTMLSRETILWSAQRKEKGWITSFHDVILRNLALEVSVVET